MAPMLDSSTIDANTIPMALLPPPEKAVAGATSTPYRLITEPYPGLFQVRVTENFRKKGGFSRTFSARQYGSRSNALAAALAARNERLANAPAPSQRLAREQLKDAARGQRLPGISRSVRIDARGPVREYLVLQVLWRDRSGRQRNKTFHVGIPGVYTAGQLDHACKTAEWYRRRYLTSLARGVAFEPPPMANWRHVKYYGRRARVDWERL